MWMCPCGAWVLWSVEKDSAAPDPATPEVAAWGEQYEQSGWP